MSVEPTYIEQLTEGVLKANPRLRRDFDAELEHGRAEAMRRQIIRKLVAHRRSIGLTQSALGAHLGVSASYISRIERLTAPVSLERLVDICVCLGARLEFEKVDA